jgi:hypothetical protein
MNHDGSEPSLHDLRSAEPRQNVADLHPAEFERLSTIARGAYETSRLLLYRNVRERSEQ